MPYYKCLDCGDGSCVFYSGLNFHIDECIGYHYSESPPLIMDKNGTKKKQPKPVRLSKTMIRLVEDRDRIIQNQFE